ncbi:hypothetical protein A2872_04005 [Candidatus Gottesmanbacteria bacterium RIFCSPHIGHO2_01_FULL_42_12]|uniref:Carrier domain-containing protein n=1 Tax=Candidatus Gottesmanbacteria bacterium RIFCSPHIGHO2_01_FULL_42_12 TaxID=1798377 RepID=A0A1F5Z4B9_9BACT|nr:MAG: hypothetical protein A2872_04005 [Candidatus Gottesmanbacteria bacterium RIFCSPHIGHO2_01_FULL_42_12]
MYETIPEFLASVANRYPTKYALYIRRFLRTTRFTYREVEQISLKIASYLLENGLKPQDKVLIWAPNMPEWVLALFGCLSAGIVVVPVGLHSTEEVVGKYIEQTRPKVLFLSKFYPIDFKKPEHKNIKIINLEDLVGLVENVSIKKMPNLSKNELGEIVFTSGTTGEPKGVMISHHNILFEIEQLLKTVPHFKHYRLLSVLPLSHVMEQVVGLMTPIARGGTIYYLPRINTVTIKKALRKYQITDLGAVPQMLRMFLDSIEYQVTEQGKSGSFNFALKLAAVLPITLRRQLFSKIHEDLGGKLYVFGVGSAPLDVKLAETWEAMGIKVVEGYGASETTGGVTANRIDDRIIGSAGKKIPGMELKLSSENEIQVKSDSVTRGYFENEEKTREAFTADGYFKTGDVGYLKDGYLYITGREKFKIVTAAGDKIYPEDIERKLNSHPDVWDSCVMGIKKDDGEIVHAEIILKPKAATKVEDIVKKINLELEPNQQIMDFSLWTDKDFPRLHTLKVDRNEVRSMSENTSQTKNKVTNTTISSEDTLKNILSKVCKIPGSSITDNSNLVTDLKLDSLKRVELVSLIEEEMGVELIEEDIDNETTLKNIKQQVSSHKKISYPYDLDSITKKLREPFSSYLRILLQDLFVFPILRFFVKVEVKGDIDFSRLKLPIILIGNHPNPPSDIGLLLSILPLRIRLKLAAPANDWPYRTQKYLINAILSNLLGGTFPINTHGKPVGKSLDAILDFIEDGYSLYIMPEGDVTPIGEKLGPLKPGLAQLFANTDVQFVPFYISGDVYGSFYRQKDEHHTYYFPHGFSKIIFTFGKPFTLLDKDENESMVTIKEKILELAPSL